MESGNPRAVFRRLVADRASSLAIGLGLSAFTWLGIAVSVGWLRGLDLGMASLALGYAAPRWDVLASGIAVGLSFEASMAIAALLTALLWRSGGGLWVLAPFGFVALTVVELMCKLLLNQSTLPPEIHRPVSYPLLHIELPGSFPSGHALRTAYLACFAIPLLRPRSRLVRVALVACLLALAIVFAFSRVYLGEHWLSDVLAGFALGGSCGWAAGRVVAWAMGPMPRSGSTD